MSISQAIISGVIQGITEFFPISSSGHLVILHRLFGMKKDMVAFDVFLHFGTLMSIIFFFRKDIAGLLKNDRAMLKFIIIGSIPTFIIGMLFKDIVEPFFVMPRPVGYFLVLTGIFLMLSSIYAVYCKIARKEKPLSPVNSFIIGIAQGIAVLPGVSRSGMTIGSALIAGVNEETALKFSFLLALPAVLGANLLKAGQICGNLISVETVPFMTGCLAAAITGFFAIKVLLGILRKNLFFLFGIYCILMGAVIIAVL